MNIKDFEHYIIYPSSIACNSIIINLENGKIQKSVIDINGYERVYLREPTNIYHRYRVHRKYMHLLLAEAFIPNPMRYSEVKHKDGDIKNNQLENLEWVPNQITPSTFRFLPDYQYKKVLSGTQILKKIKTEKDITEIIQDLEKINIGS